MASSRRFLVTGAAGFVGANLCRRLIAEGQEVHVLAKPTSRLWRLDDLRGQLKIHHADMTDAPAIDRLVDLIRPTVIYHLATHGAYHYQNDAEQVLLVNVMGLWNLVRACNRVGYELLVNTGSSSEYGHKEFAMRETDLLDPNSFYAVAKASQSLLCQHVGRSSGGHTIVTLRLFSVYGPYEEPTRLIPHLMMAAIEDKPIDMVGPLTARDFIHVDDVVDVYLQIDQLKKYSGQILNVGTGIQTSLAQLIDEMGQVHDRPIQARWGAMEQRPWDATSWVADASKLRRLLGPMPRTSLRDGLARTLAWFREHRGLYLPANIAGAS